MSSPGRGQTGRYRTDRGSQFWDADTFPKDPLAVARRVMDDYSQGVIECWDLDQQHHWETVLLAEALLRIDKALHAPTDAARRTTDGDCVECGSAWSSCHSSRLVNGPFCCDGCQHVWDTARGS